MQTVIYIKADKEVKENAAEAAKELGLSLSDVINASLRNFIRTREITFSHVPQMTPELEKLLDRVEEDIKHNRNIVGPFHNAEEMDRYLDSK
ncbi:MAG: type II toxin-antitoxin system RelB/DinJ family antitoxin [Candidatus Levybacteria bacterium]|nr:type II toxin-antitoxin system RelB/DinJ family antitoxin [Candidatus Levybacteria bacterium]MDZ4228081.1 type II toxin-antitoxin system RelB/DinJ family antitoxin [Candidatus Levybacteria bacterium]